MAGDLTLRYERCEVIYRDICPPVVFSAPAAGISPGLRPGCPPFLRCMTRTVKTSGAGLRRPKPLVYLAFVLAGIYFGQDGGVPGDSGKSGNKRVSRGINRDDGAVYGRAALPFLEKKSRRRQNSPGLFMILPFGRIWLCGLETRLLQRALSLGPCSFPSFSSAIAFSRPPLLLLSGQLA